MRVIMDVFVWMCLYACDHGCVCMDVIIVCMDVTMDVFVCV